MAQEEHGQLSLLGVNYNTIGVHVSMVSTWGDRQCRLPLAFAMLVKLAQTCVGAVGFFTAPVVHVCCNNEVSDSARTITTAGTGADRRVCMPATRDALFI